MVRVSFKEASLEWSEADERVVREDNVRSDPDPFMVGIGIFAAIAAGGQFLETRRARRAQERREREAAREAYRSAWFNARRSLIIFKRVVDEFETYILEDNYGQRAFRIGEVRLVVDTHRHQALRRLKGQALTTANFVSDNMDDLSDFLSAEHQSRVDEILTRLKEITFPESYGQVIRLAREINELYFGLLSEVAENEGFEQEISGN